MGVMVAFASTLFAIRLLRELAVQRPTPGERFGADQENGMQGGPVAVDTPGTQPFRPFSGSAYRLANEAGEPKEAKEPNSLGTHGQMQTGLASSAIAAQQLQVE